MCPCVIQFIVCKVVALSEQSDLIWHMTPDIADNCKYCTRGAVYLNKTKIFSFIIKTDTNSHVKYFYKNTSAEWSFLSACRPFPLRCGNFVFFSRIKVQILTKLGTNYPLVKIIQFLKGRGEIKLLQYHLSILNETS